MDTKSASRDLGRSVWMVSPAVVAWRMRAGRRWHLPVACAGVFLAALGLYARTAAPTIYALDSSGLTRAAVLVQPAHPPGYPLYVLLGKLFSLALPVGDMGQRLNLMSAFFAALTLALLVALLAVLDCPPIVGTATALVLGGSYYFWSIATMAEVYALQAALVVALLLALALWRAHGRRRWLWLAALLFGLALSNHPTTVLLLPGIVAFIWLVARQRPPDMRTWRLVPVLLCVGPLLYLLLPLRGDLHSLGELLGFLLARDFWPAVFSYSPAGYAHELTALAGLLWANFLGAGIVLGGVGLVAARAGDRGLLALVGGGFLISLAFFSGYQVADKDLMLAPVLLLWAVWIGLGLNRLLGGVDSLAPSPPARQAIRLGLVAAASLVWALNFTYADLSHDWRVRRQAEQVFGAVQDRAVVLVGSWVDLQPLRYLQEVEGERPDVALVDAQSPHAARAAAALVDLVIDTRPVYAVGPSAATNLGHDRVWLPGCGCFRLLWR